MVMMMMMNDFRFNDASTHDGHLRQNGVLTWFCNETDIMISHLVLWVYPLLSRVISFRINIFILTTRHNKYVSSLSCN